MGRILVTGMSGTGKSSALAEPRARGFDVLDTDEPGWTDWSDEEDGVRIGSRSCWPATAR